MIEILMKIHVKITIIVAKKQKTLSVLFINVKKSCYPHKAVTLDVTELRDISRGGIL